MKVLSFDTATKTGCAFGVAGGKPRSWTVDLGKVVWEARFSKTLRMVRHFVDKLDPDLITVEAFVGGPKANTDLAGLVACVMGEAHRLGVPIKAYWPSSIRSHFLGGARSKAPIKQQVYARCLLLGWTPGDTDQSDALALWDYSCMKENPQHAMSSIGGIFR